MLLLIATTELGNGTQEGRKMREWLDKFCKVPRYPRPNVRNERTQLNFSGRTCRTSENG
jgi:hypothetical protein